MYGYMYGLDKVHKQSTPLRPVLSISGSCYYNIAKQMADWLFVVDKCKINSSTKLIAESLKNIRLEENEGIISFDVSSLHTNVDGRLSKFD